MNEAEFTTAVIDAARLYRWRVAHFRPAQVRPGRWVTPMQGDTGFPDLVLARDGVVILAELKTDKGRLRPGQPEWAEQIGIQYRLWRPRDMDQIIEELKWTTSMGRTTGNGATGASSRSTSSKPSVM